MTAIKYLGHRYVKAIAISKVPPTADEKKIIEEAAQWMTVENMGYDPETDSFDDLSDKEWDRDQSQSESQIENNIEREMKDWRREAAKQVARLKRLGIKVTKMHLVWSWDIKDDKKLLSQVKKSK